MEEKLRIMLAIYREKLEKANMKPVDYVEGIRCEAVISVLENLYHYVVNEQSA